jgi:hypothetical protein
MTKFSSFFSEADVEKMTHRTSFGRCGIGDEIRRHVVYCRSEQVPLTSTTNLLCTLGDERPALRSGKISMAEGQRKQGKNRQSDT